MMRILWIRIRIRNTATITFLAMVSIIVTLVIIALFANIMIALFYCDIINNLNTKLLG